MDLWGYTLTLKKNYLTPILLSLSVITKIVWKIAKMRLKRNLDLDEKKGFRI